MTAHVSRAAPSNPSAHHSSLDRKSLFANPSPRRAFCSTLCSESKFMTQSVTAEKSSPIQQSLITDLVIADQSSLIPSLSFAAARAVRGACDTCRRRHRYSEETVTCVCRRWLLCRCGQPAYPYRHTCCRGGRLAAEPRHCYGYAHTGIPMLAAAAGNDCGRRPSRRHTQHAADQFQNDCASRRLPVASRPAVACRSTPLPSRGCTRNNEELPS